MNHRSSFVIVVAGLLVHLVACNKRQEFRADPSQPVTLAQPSTLATVTTLQNPEQYNTINSKSNADFEVNPAELSAELIDSSLGLKFAPPKDYQRLGASAVQTSVLFGALSLPPQTGIRTTPLYGFNNEKTQNALLISRVAFSSKDTGFTQQVAKYERVLKEKFDPSPVSVVSFVKDNISMVQFFVQNEDRGIMRVIFAADKRSFFQFDYTIQRQTAKTDLDVIESSIGSIFRFNSKQPIP